MTSRKPLTPPGLAGAAGCGERTRWLRRTWIALGAPSAWRRIHGAAAIAVVAAAVGLLACPYTTGQGSNLGLLGRANPPHHRPARVRLQNPGFEQLGAVWLPITHLLLMPFIINLWMFSNGWAPACWAPSHRRARRRAGASGHPRHHLHLHHRPHRTGAAHVPGGGNGRAGAPGEQPSPHERRELAVLAGVPSGAAVRSRYEG